LESLSTRQTSFKGDSRQKGDKKGEKIERVNKEKDEIRENENGRGNGRE